MDTTKILLSTACAILLGAVLWNVKGQKNNASPSELAKIQKQLDEIKNENFIIESEKRLRDLGISSTTATPAKENKMEEMEAKIAAMEAKAQEAETLRKEAEKQAVIAKDETSPPLDAETRDKQMRRAKQINQATLMATVKEYVNDPKFGGFVTISIVNPDLVSADTELGIRRNGIVIGKLKVRQIEGTEAVADIIPGAASFTPQVGDELIIDPFS